MAVVSYLQHDELAQAVEDVVPAVQRGHVRVAEHQRWRGGGGGVRRRALQLEVKCNE